MRNRTTGGTTRYDATYYYQDGSLWDHTGNPVKRVENLTGSTYTTTLRYDAVYRQTEETKRDSGNNVVYSLTYGYDAVGNRTTNTLGGTTITYTYDDNNKLTSANDGSSFGYDSNGNMTSVSGPLGSKTMVYDDENHLTSIAYGGVTDLYYYTYKGLRYRGRLAGTYYRYLYNGERVLEELNDSGTMQARYTTENGSYYSTWLHLYRPSGTLSRFPMYDNIGTARGLVDASGAVTDTYELDTFGRSVSSTGTTPNPYRYGGAWGYITDPSGMEQLGQRFYWPELGRFVSQDPIAAEVDRYLYGMDNPVRRTDPEGLCPTDDPPCKANAKCKKGCDEDYARHEARANRRWKWESLLCTALVNPYAAAACLSAAALARALAHDENVEDRDICKKRCDENYKCPPNEGKP